ncbi:hypothetical protein BD779DRAFT_1675607 [Infundibulicybe gibba]|nr:hypothetical protein BD779DRAFT_1675607 [Infundibulicybe gibba]
MPSQYICTYCLHTLPTGGSLRQHQAKAVKCRNARDAALRDLVNRAANFSQPEKLNHAPEVDVNQEMEENTTHDLDALADIEANTTSGHDTMMIDSENVDLEGDELDDSDNPDPDPVCPARMVEVEDEDWPTSRRWTVPFPVDQQVGETFGNSPTTFEVIRDDQILNGDEVLGPFKNEDEWQLAKWLIKNVGHGQADEFLKLPIIQQRVAPAFSSKDKLLQTIDSLPGGVDWKLESVKLTGDLVDEDGVAMTEDLEIWYRDPVECVRELMGNPMFAEVMKYAPEKIYEDKSHTSQVVDEMWTAEWWWKIQELLPTGATVAPLILSSDKTKLSQFRGDKSAWPVYLTIGNISKNVRRQSSTHATVLLGYLPVGKFDCFSEKTRQAMRYRTFHHCMSILTNSLTKAGTEGVDMACADGLVRWVWPILAAYIADYPEQCLVACCMENRCPICKVRPTERGKHSSNHDLREKDETLILLALKETGCEEPSFKTKYSDQGLRPVCPPFWAQLPHSNIFQSFTPDLLHQLHKGVFKDHLVKWCTQLAGAHELDSRFKAMTSYVGLRHFKNGISGVSQWTGSEHKAMERVFVGLLAGSVVEDAIHAARAVVDFIFYSSLQSHTTKSLAALKQALDDFHKYKDIFIKLEARVPPHFNIPKIHSMEHYLALILQFGRADGFNTESPERLHIDYAKNAYRASNKKDYTIQMTRWLQRQEAVDRFTWYLEWAKDGSYKPTQVQPHCILPTSTTLTVQRTPIYTVALHHPKELRGIEAQAIIVNHNATQFLPAVQTFLANHGSRILAQPFDGFNLFKRIVLRLPNIPQANPNDLINIVRATPPRPPRGRTPAEAARLDFALIRTAERSDKTDGTALRNLRVAHVRVIFKLPDVYSIQTAHPLAYVEWYTPFHHIDPSTGVFIIKPSTRSRHVHGEVIGVDRIARSCHITPRHGRKKNIAWTSENVVDRCKSFHPSPYSDTHIFCALKLDMSSALYHSNDQNQPRNRPVNLAFHKETLPISHTYLAVYKAYVGQYNLM